MRVLVTGCMGFIGSHVVSQLLRSGHLVLGIDNLSNVSRLPTDRMKKESGQNWDKFQFYQLDINDKALLPILHNSPVDHIVHLAARGSVPYSFKNPVEVMKNNIDGFVTMCEIAKLFKVKKFVFASSSSVYGTNNYETEMRFEGIEGRVTSPYALTKKFNEDYVKLIDAVPFVGLRFFNVYGPGQRADSPYSAIIPKLLTHDVVTLNGDTVRDYTYVGDVALAIEKSLTCTVTRLIANVGTGRGTSLTVLAEMAKKLRPELVIKYGEARTGDVEVSIASTSHGNNYLGLGRRVHIQDGLMSTYESYKNEATKTD